MIEVKNLTKKYGDHIAVDNLSFSIPRGGIYGFLGPNGAGKSTTMNIMTGCLAATSGEVLIDGHDIFESPTEAKKSVGYLPEQPPVYMDMTPVEYLTFVAEAKKVARSKIKEEVEAVMRRTGLTEMRNRLIRNLSKGYRQRVGIAQAILGNPELIILDEPTVGLDPKQILEIRDLIKGLGKEHTVILSSHILSEVSAVCDHIMIISHGKMVASSKTDELSTMLRGSNVLDLIVKCDEARLRAALDKVKGIDQIKIVSSENNELHAEVQYELEQDLREEIFNSLVGSEIIILGMTLTTASLEDVFIELTSDNGEEEAAS